MFRGPSLIVSTMQAGTTPIFKPLWYDWTQHQPGIEPTKPFGQCLVPPIVAFYDQQGLLRTYSSTGGSIRSPHPGSPRGETQRRACKRKDGQGRRGKEKGSWRQSQANQQHGSLGTVVTRSKGKNTMPSI